MKTARVLVAGAGVGGLTAALALSRGGYEVEVAEQAPVLGEIGAGVTLTPNGMRVFDHLGIGEEIAAAGIEPTRQRIQHWEDGRVLAVLERGDSMRERYGAPYVYIHRADFHSILVRAIAGRADIRLDAKVESASASAGGAVAALASGETIEADLIVGADGVKSAVRRSFEEADAHFTGHVVWRALAPIDNAALADLAGFPGMHIGPGRMAVRYPVRGAEVLNIVFFARQTGWAEEGWTIPAAVSELERHFGDWAPEVRTLMDAVDERRLNKWAVFARKPLPSWVVGDRITLLGDAAHAMTPFMGQGAGCAAEDALVLTRALQDSETLAEALARYQTARKPRCDFIQAESNDNADRLQRQDTGLFGLEKLRNEETLGLFEYDAGAVPV